MGEIVSIFRLIRLHNCLMAGIGVWLGGYLADVSGGNINLVLASIAAALVCGAGNAVNDFLDVEADRLNHPGRPLPAGELPLYTSLLIAAVFGLIAVGMAFIVGWEIGAIVILSILLLTAYNLILKRLPFWGNFSISLLGGATFVVGGLLAGPDALIRFPGPLVPAIFAVFFHLCREFIKDMADYEGDKQVQIRTLPMALGNSSIMVLTSVLYSVLILLTLVPVFLQWYRPAYGYIAVFLVDLPLVALLVYLRVARAKRKFSAGGSVLKLLMAFGMFAFLLGKN
jgi:geranylgeranylglycerol-phosphate geranylgeranyltransferase